MTDPSIPSPPPLPEGLPAPLRDFIECRTTTATIENGPLTWIALPPEARGFLGGKPPVLDIQPGPAPGTATLRVSAGFISASLPASVANGRLSIDTSKLPFWAPAGLAAEIDRFVGSLNGWLAANGWSLGPPAFGPRGLTLTKVPIQPR
jgi:hypothetical protein